MSSFDSDWGDELIFDLWPSDDDPEELVVTCDDHCDRFYVKCPYHTLKRQPCHHLCLVYTDGACKNNGAQGSASGIGIAFGLPDGHPRTGESYQFSIPIDDEIDPGGKRTNQRAELLAAIHGLKKVCKCSEKYLMEQMEIGTDYYGRTSPEVIVACDSEYVVEGITQWLHRWRANSLRKADGERPSNIDLFLELGATVEACRFRYGCKIRFWRIDRDRNTIADALAKRAAEIASEDIFAF